MTLVVFFSIFGVTFTVIESLDIEVSRKLCGEVQHRSYWISESFADCFTLLVIFFPIILSLLICCLVWFFLPKQTLFRISKTDKQLIISLIICSIIVLLTPDYSVMQKMILMNEVKTGSKSRNSFTKFLLSSIQFFA